jgi:cytochrome c oxidase subunit 2
MPIGVRRIAFATFFTSVAALVAASVALAGNGGFLPPTPHSPNAQRIVDAYWVVAAFTGAIFILVEGALVAFIVKYRRGKRARTADGLQLHGATRLEIGWTVAPVIILAIIASFVFYKLPGIADAPKARAADETVITVEGHQFYWLFRYPGGGVSINTMIAPAGEVVHENVVGLPFDVAHSWWVPQLGGKFDAIPGKTNKTWFQAPVGTYDAKCAELCGIQHALMLGQVKVVPRAQYQQFISSRANPSQADTVALGKEEFQGVCMSCHRLDHKFIGPALGGNPLLAQESGLTTLLRHGRNLMPAVGRNWSQRQIQALIAYTKQFAKG